MDLLDVVIIVLALEAALHGARVGALVQVVSLLGVLAGFALGAALIEALDGRVDGALAKTLVALALLLVPASVLGGLGRRAGARALRLVRRLHLGPLDALGGMAVAVCGTLVVCWLLASILVNSELPSVSRQIEDSAVIRATAAVLPPVPDAFASVERYLSENGFPEVLVNALPESVTPVVPASAAAVRATYERDGDSTVKVVATGCGDIEQEGSGFAVTDDLVVTNAHVVAGTLDIVVSTELGRTLRATPVLFDPRFDLAVLRTAPLGIRPLLVDPSLVERGTRAVVLGYPNGGPLRAAAAGVVSRFRAEGRDIYDSAITERVVYGLQADVQPGNSGGPLVAADGAVIGVVFSRSASTRDLGYALGSPGVAQRVTEARGRRAAVSTRACIE